MTQLLVALITIGIPAALAYGSSSRRQLNLIRDEAKTIEAVEGSGVEAAALTALRGKLGRTMTDYANRDEQPPYALLLGTIGFLMLTYVAGAAGYLLLAGSDIGTRAIPDETNRFFTGAGLLVFASVTFFIAYGVFTARLLAHRRARRRHQRPPSGSGPKKPGKVDDPSV